MQDNFYSMEQRVEYLRQYAYYETQRRTCVCRKVLTRVNCILSVVFYEGNTVHGTFVVISPSLWNDIMTTTRVVLSWA